jgi:hypothetical protein
MGFHFNNQKIAYMRHGVGKPINTLENQTISEQIDQECIPHLTTGNITS